MLKKLLLEKISALAFVRKVEKIDNGLTVSLESAGKNLQELLAVAGEVDFVEVHSPDLNDVFIHFTGKEIRDEKGGIIEQIRNFNRVSKK